MKALLVPVFVILALVSAAVPLSAHHSWPVSYDRLVTVKGTVTEFAWANPHPMITLEVRTDDGKTEKWMVGGPAINRMEANGWTKDDGQARRRDHGHRLSVRRRPEDRQARAGRAGRRQGDAPLRPLRTTPITSQPHNALFCHTHAAINQGGRMRWLSDPDTRARHFTWGVACVGGLGRRLNIYSASAGSGNAAVVFVHGWTCDSSSWDGADPVPRGPLPGPHPRSAGTRAAAIARQTESSRWTCLRGRWKPCGWRRRRTDRAGRHSMGAPASANMRGLYRGMSLGSSLWTARWT